MATGLEMFDALRKATHALPAGTVLGIKLCIAKEVRNLIPGEGFRRMARVPIDDGQTVDELLEEVDRIRHPERYPA